MIRPPDPSLDQAANFPGSVGPGNWRAVYYQIADPEFVEICRTMCMRVASQLDAQKPLKKDLLQFAAQH